MDRLRREGGRYSASTPSSRAKPVAEGEDEYGRVVTLKQSFGFIRCGSRVEPNGRETQVFFHASEFHPEIPNRDKPSLDPGDLVKFTTAPSAKGDGQTNGFNVRKCEESEVALAVLAAWCTLASGILVLEKASPQKNTLSGTIKKLLTCCGR